MLQNLRSSRWIIPPRRRRLLPLRIRLLLFLLQNLLPSWLSSRRLLPLLSQPLQQNLSRKQPLCIRFPRQSLQ